MDRNTGVHRNKKRSIFDRLANNPVAIFYGKIDSKISENFRLAKVTKRTEEGNGIWCCVLIPTILILYTIMLDVPRQYRLTAYLSVGMFVYSFVFSLFMYLTSLVLVKPSTSGVTAASLIATIPIYLNLGNLLVSLAFAVISTLSYCKLLNIAIMKFQKTFTPGEAMVVCQEIVLYIMYSLINLYLYIYEPESIKMDVDLFMIKIFIITAYSTVGLMIAVVYMMDDNIQDVTAFGYLVASAVAYALIVIHTFLGVNAIPRLFYYLFGKFTRVKLFFIWLCLMAVAVAVLVTHTKAGLKASSGTRKVFHVLAAMVFLSGILIDINMLILASGIMLAVLIMVEALRLSKVEPVATPLQAAFEIYCDQQDSGMFAMTPLYLFVGLACPLVLVPGAERPGAPLELLSGFLTLGLGDAAASYFGERYGQRNWPNSKKTLEGTVCNIVSQLLVVFILETFELLVVRACLFRVLVAAVVSALLEALTHQVDNLILPLISILAFQVTLRLG